MAKRRLFESKTLDMTTGEVKSITTVTVSKLNERFIMCRTTDSLSWLKEFTGKELQMLMVLNQIENLQTKTVTLTPLLRKEIMEFFSIGKSTLSGMLTAMEDKKFLLRLSASDLLLNPSFFYKGDSKDVLQRIKDFKQVYEERRGKPKVDIKDSQKAEQATGKQDTTRGKKMETTIGPYRIRYEWEIEMNPDTLCETDRRYIKQEVEDLGSVGGDLYIGDEVVGHWELIETEYKQKEEEQL